MEQTQLLLKKFLLTYYIRDFEATGISSVFPNGSVMGRQPWAVEFHDFFTQRNIVGIFRKSENNSQVISQRCWGV